MEALIILDIICIKGIIIDSPKLPDSSSIFLLIDAISALTKYL